VGFQREAKANSPPEVLNLVSKEKVLFQFTIYLTYCQLNTEVPSSKQQQQPFSIKRGFKENLKLTVLHKFCI